MNERKNPDYGIYVHVPFCRRKCIYCDFFSISDRNADWDRYMKALEAEFVSRKEELAGAGSVSLYIGGGTPSLMPPEMIGKLRNMIDLPVGEFTIEVNPDDVTADKAQSWREGGANRVSMGVQSLMDEELRMMGRRHDARMAVEAYEILRTKFDNISLDLMFGLPWQTPETLKCTLDGFIEMAPEHISAYSLMYEEATALTRGRDAGKIAEMPESDNVAMFATVSRRLAEAGYERYEISNYCKSGYRAVHNSLYWAGKPYMGLGPGAHSYDGIRVRRSNPADLGRYLGEMEKRKGDMENYPGNAYDVTEELSDEELREEMIMTRLRTVEGLDIKEYERRFGVNSGAELMRKASKWDTRGLDIDGVRIALSPSGVMISDEIIASLF